MAIHLNVPPVLIKDNLCLLNLEHTGYQMDLSLSGIRYIPGLYGMIR